MNTIHIMKKSLYNHLSFIDESWVLYNAFTDEVSVLAPEVKELYEKHDVDEIRKIHPEFYDYLQVKQFLVPENENESSKCIAQWDKEDNDPSSFSLTVNPTLDCNMSCWYCYEKHQVNRTMKEEISERVYKFIANKMADPLLKSFDLSFFGGEPLIQFKHIVKPLAEFAHQQAISNGKNFEVGFTTNGYLLFPKVLDFLSSLKVPVHFQITLDGNERMHNKTRHTANGTGSYFKILENCKNALTNASLNLPQNWQIATDINLYSRRGYNDNTLNTTNWVWNTSVAKTILKGNLTFRLNAVDILKQISNVQHTVNAQGRTETWVNSQPRYVMLHVVYRFNVMPKKKKS